MTENELAEEARKQAKDSFKGKMTGKNQKLLKRLQEQPIESDSVVNRWKDETPLGL